MSKFLNTLGKAQLSIGICDRCKVKYPIGDLKGDRNSPGLRVCNSCCDVLDPYRLPARQTEDITVRHPRPDTEVSDNTGNMVNPFSEGG